MWYSQYPTVPLHTILATFWTHDMMIWHLAWQPSQGTEVGERLRLPRPSARFVADGSSCRGRGRPGGIVARARGPDPRSGRRELRRRGVVRDANAAGRLREETGWTRTTGGVDGRGHRRARTRTAGRGTATDVCTTEREDDARPRRPPWPRTEDEDDPIEDRGGMRRGRGRPADVKRTKVRTIGWGRGRTGDGRGTVDESRDGGRQRRTATEGDVDLRGRARTNGRDDRGRGRPAGGGDVTARGTSRTSTDGGRGTADDPRGEGRLEAEDGREDVPARTRRTGTTAGRGYDRGGDAGRCGGTAEDVD